MHGGTIVDATIIDAPSSTKNKEKKRDPEMHQTIAIHENSATVQLNVITRGGRLKAPMLP